MSDATPTPNVRTQTTIVVLEVLQDFETGPDNPAPLWWEALGLPRPERWSEQFNTPRQFTRVLVERRSVR